MAQTQSTISRFLSWWQTGLAAPFAQAQSTLVVRVIDGVVCDLNGLDFNDSTSVQKTGLMKSNRAALLVPPESVLTKAVTESQKGLPLNAVVAEALPFELDELICSFDHAQENIICVLKADLSEPQKALDAHGFDDVGTAFAIGSGAGESYLILENNDEFECQKSVIPQPWFLALSAVICLLLIVSSLGFIYLSKSEGVRHAQLNASITTLRSQLPDGQFDSVLLSSMTVRDAESVASLLESLASQLSASTVIDQLILSEGELLIDASAASASELLSNMEQSSVYESSGFVSSISRNTAINSTVLNSEQSRQERFRIKATLKNDLKNSGAEK
ncbi:MAG: hypothetical protein ACI9LU_000572 [Polaribacter sp.]|jgi:hypothetical protein